MQGNNTFRRAARAFTLIELLVVIAIIALLISIVMPAMGAARESGREAMCRANLTQFGQGVMAYANVHDDFLCSGSFDPEATNGRDGFVDQVGWVADLVNSDSAMPGRQLCPSNPARYNQKLGPNGNTYTDKDAVDLVQRGYNTNYTQAWYMARTEWNPSVGDYNWKRLISTYGPLHLSALKNVSSSRVPLLGDGRTDPDNKVLGDRSVKTMTDGPYSGPYDTQNYADFGPAHGMASYVWSKGIDGIRANILFADGHVGFFKDQDRDGTFSLNTTVAPAAQKDLGADVFDGVLSLGRRSGDAFELK